ncbi:Hypothetical protein PHPALM_3337 [Phytophthora palmivora]|uniref:Uncharacterized protein n=1 Tax=Phytophthora palmivora TaxID=4796 RepID=A0A2P4YMP9_9STRA|nr:Hypothetical protein PHPALM_3337 [Phytophthora palmivora]
MLSSTSLRLHLKDLSPRECVAVLQTKFFDVGFRFLNLIPEWFRAHASQMDRSLIRAVAEDLQHLLTMELLEWREVTSGVPSRMLSPQDVRALTDTVEDMKPEDAEGDSLMSGYEAGLLGSECVEQLKKAGVRVTRSPASSSLGEPELKRPQHLPPRPASTPSMSSLMSYGTSAQDSRSTAIPSEVSGTRSASPMPSSGYGSTLFGLTASGSEEANCSRPMSSSSSLWSMGGAASAHMPYSFVAPPGMGFAAQGSTAQVDGNVSVQVTEAVLPRSPAIVGHDDVVMSESGRTSRSDHRSRTSRSHARSLKPSPSESSSVSDSSAEERKWRSSKRSTRSSKRSSKSRKSPRRSIKSERTSRSGRTSRARMSGASQVALNTMRTTQDLLSRMESNQAHLGQQVQQEFHAIQALAVRGSPPEGRSSPSVPDRASRSDLPPRSPAPIPPARTPASLQTVDAARAEGAHTALESARVEVEERWQQRETKVEAEKVAWVADKMHSLEEAHNRDQETIRDLQNVQGMRSRNTPATHPQAQDTRATYGSDSANSSQV